MIDLVRFSSDPLHAFCARTGVEPLIFSGEGILHSQTITLLDGSPASNKTLPQELSRTMPDLLFGCEWIGEHDHMDYPQHALRIQTARTIRNTSTIYVFTPAILERRTFEVARFNARILRAAKVPVVFASLARTQDDLAAVKDMQALGTLLGFSDNQIASAYRLLEKLPATKFEEAFALEIPR